MDAVTYPQKKVSEFIEKNLVPLRVAYDAQPLASDFKVTWTPTLITTDPKGREHHRTVGFLSPEQLIPSLMLGIAKFHFDENRYDAALAILQELLTQYPQSDSAPEAIYLQGVSRYKSTHSPQPLKDAYEYLQKSYPSSEWTRRAAPYRLL